MPSTREFTQAAGSWPPSVTVTVPDGSFDLALCVPDAGHGPGLVLVQEIFGVGPFIRAIAERLAGLGYVVGAPDMFWREEPHFNGEHTEAGMARSIEVAMKTVPEKAVGDCLASLASLAALDEVDGQPGVMGFCFGGSMAWATAIYGDPSVAVSYYGSEVPSMLGDVDQITCPVLLHFGEDDAFLPVEGARRVEAAVAGRADIEAHIHPGAGHAFANHEAPMFHQPEVAAEAWVQTTAFLSRHLPVH